MINPTLITHINLLNEAGDGWLPESTVLISDRKIKAVNQPDTVAGQDVTVVDGKGGYLMPGLIEFHGHFYGRATTEMRSQHKAYAPLYLSGGVTTVRTPGEFEPLVTWEWKQRIAAGEEIGPRIMTGGYYFDPENTIIRWFKPCPSVKAIEEVFETRNTVSDFFKCYSSMPKAWIHKVCDLGHAKAKKVYAHLGMCGTIDAVNAGLDGVEHGIFTVSEFYPAPNAKVDDAAIKALDLNSEIVKRVQDTLVSHRTALTPTCLTFMLNGSWFTNWMDAVDAWRYLDEVGLERQRTMRNEGDAKQEQVDLQNELMEKQRKYVNSLYRQGVRIFAGTDPSYPMMIPGQALWLEAINLSDCGMSNADILRALTIEAAKELGISDETGWVAEGKDADLILLEMDPLRDIRNLSSLRRVWKAGQVFEPEALREMAVGQLV